MSAATAARAAQALAVPLARALGLTLLDPAQPSAGVRFVVGELAGNGAGGLHASALGVALETAGFLAVLPVLADDEHAVTHSTSVQLIGAVAGGAAVEAIGTLQRRTKRLAFVTVTATCADTLFAQAQLTKSIVRRG